MEMTETTRTTDAGSDAAPRTYYPDYRERADVPMRTPGWDAAVERRLDDGRTLARQLGWASLALGAVELLAAEKVTEFLGVDDRHTGLVRAFGAREIASGIAILSQRHPTAPVWGRVAGDMLDLAALSVALGSKNANHGRVFGAMAFVAGVTALDVLCANQLSADPNAERAA